jgi:hypothetical protein
VLPAAAAPVRGWGRQAVHDLVGPFAEHAPAAFVVANQPGRLAAAVRARIPSVAARRSPVESTHPLWLAAPSTGRSRTSLPDGAGGNGRFRWAAICREPAEAGMNPWPRPPGPGCPVGHPHVRLRSEA